tara:strand:+ start:328 stop:573 length:246 start_codon:yes stop_codon:yes gene_type:complete
MKNSLKTNLISKLKLINLFLIIFGFNSIDIDLKAHLRGYYSSESEAKEKAKDLGCLGTFKLKEMWMPCESEKDLHKYLRKK